MGIVSKAKAPARSGAERAEKPGVEPGVWLVLLAAVCWGTTGTTQAFAPAGASPLSVGAARLAVGGGALVLLALLQGQARQLHTLPLWPTLGAAATLATYQLTFFAGVRLAGVATGTLFAIGSAPILAGLLTWLLHGRAPGARWVLATALAVTGAVLLVLGGDGASAQEGAASSLVMGLLLAVGAGASYAVFTLCSARMVASAPPGLAAAASFGLGALLLLPVFAFTDGGWLASPRGMGVALMLGLVATALPYQLYNRALRFVPVNTAVTLALAEPLTASLLGVALLGERLPPLGWLGVALVFAGLLVLTVARR